DPKQARTLTARGLAMFADVAGRDPDHVSQYAYWLTMTPVSELRNPRAAREAAERAIAGVDRPYAGLLRSLALACQGVGDYAEAPRAAERALTLLAPQPPGQPPTGLRRELEALLAELRTPGVSKSATLGAR